MSSLIYFDLLFYFENYMLQKIWEYQKALREWQWSKLIANDIGHDATKTSYGSDFLRRKKCGETVNKFVANLDITLQKFNDGEKKDIVQRIMEHQTVTALLANHINFSKGLEKALQALRNMQKACRKHMLR